MRWDAGRDCATPSSVRHGRRRRRRRRKETQGPLVETTQLHQLGAVCIYTNTIVYMQKPRTA